jgi:hypothetical protein
MAQNVTQGISGPAPPRRPVVLLLTSNGWGMGHLSRQLALAMALGERAEPVFLSLSGAVHLVAEQGFRAEYCGSPSRGWLDVAPWNAYLAQRVLALARETEAQALVFDGVSPYRGLLEARRHLRDIAFVWSRRGMWAVGRGRDALRTGPAFDLIVEPGDLGAAADPGLTVGRDDAVRIPPVTLVDVVPQADRAEARAALGIATEAPLLLVSLSAGTGDPESLLKSVIRGVLASSAWHVAVVMNPLSPSGLMSVDHPRIHRLIDVYPLVRYLRAFDAGVVSAGYNAAHELPLSGIPTLLVANRASVWDDQLSRGRGIAERGLAMWTTDDEPVRAGDLAAALVAGKNRLELIQALDRLGPADRGGAQRVADLVLALLPATESAGGTAPRSRRRSRDEARWWLLWTRRRLRDALVATRWMALRVVRGEVRPAALRPHVDVLEEPAGTPSRTPSPNAERGNLLLFTDRLSRDVLRSAGPVEQILPAASDAYRRARRVTVRYFFDVGRWTTLRARHELRGTRRH